MRRTIVHVYLDDNGEAHSEVASREFLTDTALNEQVTHALCRLLHGTGKILIQVADGLRARRWFEGARRA